VLKLTLGVFLLATAIGAEATPLFEDETILDVELRGPFQELFDDENNEARRFELGANGVTQTISAITGGKSRMVVCTFPPIKLQFDPSQAEGIGSENDLFSGHEFLRLVTHCRRGGKGQANTIEEYLAYRILNLITDYSYRVRLLHMSYIDSANADKTTDKYAFVIETEYELAELIGGQVLAIDSLPKQRLNEAHAARVYIFHYLIGNTDWSLVTGKDDKNCCHNGQLIGIEGEIFFIPYDFDVTGLVNPRYGVPDRSLSIKRVTNRLYRGYCGPPEALHKALDHVVAQREAIIDLYQRAPVLSDAERKRGIKYLEGFFRKAQDPEKLLENFQRRCLG